MNKIPVPYDLSTYAGRVNAADSSTPYALGTADKIEYYHHTPCAPGATAFRLNRETGQWHVIGAGPSVETQVGSCTTMGANGTQTVFFGCFDGVVQFVKLARQ